MSDAALEAYIAGIDTSRAPLVMALDSAIVGAHKELDVAIKYRMLTYALGGDFYRWICAIDAHPRKAVCLRFLYGVLLDDTRQVFRGAPTSILRTIDFASIEQFDAQLVTGYVRDAVSKFDQFKAHGAK
jgi:hypothetical protein